MPTPREISNKELKAIAKAASKEAIEEDFLLGLPVVILEDGCLIRLYPDGSKEEIIK